MGTGEVCGLESEPDQQDIGEDEEGPGFAVLSAEHLSKHSISRALVEGEGCVSVGLRGSWKWRAKYMNLS